MKLLSRRCGAQSGSCTGVLMSRRGRYCVVRFSSESTAAFSCLCEVGRWL